MMLAGKIRKIFSHRLYEHCPSDFPKFGISKSIDRAVVKKFLAPFHRESICEYTGVSIIEISRDCVCMLELNIYMLGTVSTGYANKLYVLYVLDGNRYPLRAAHS